MSAKQPSTEYLATQSTRLISYTQHSVSNLSILRAPVRREPEKFGGVGTAGRLIF